MCRQLSGLIFLALSLDIVPLKSAKYMSVFDHTSQRDLQPVRAFRLHSSSQVTVTLRYFWHKEVWRAKTSIQEIRRFYSGGVWVNMYNLGRTVDEWLLPRSSCQKILKVPSEGRRAKDEGRRARGEGRGRLAVSKCFSWFENISSNQVTAARSLTVYQPSAKIWQKSFQSFSENRHKLFWLSRKWKWQALQELIFKCFYLFLLELLMG